MGVYDIGLFHQSGQPHDVQRTVASAGQVEGYGVDAAFLQLPFEVGICRLEEGDAYVVTCRLLCGQELCDKPFRSSDEEAIDDM